MCVFFFFKQKTAYEMRISDWSSDVCSSDLRTRVPGVIRNPYNGGPSPYRGSSLAKPNYSFEKRQREIAKKKKQDLKDARKREAREAAKATKSDDETPAGQPDADRARHPAHGPRTLAPRHRGLPGGRPEIGRGSGRARTCEDAEN